MIQEAPAVISDMEFQVWLEKLPDTDVESFAQTAHEVGRELADQLKDGEMGNCLVSFFDDNPRAWATEAVESIGTNCKGAARARTIVTTVVQTALSRL